MNSMNEDRPVLKLRQKIGYGIGDFGSNYCWSFVASFVMLYFSNVLGLDTAIIGTVMLLSKVLDGVSDVFMGTIIDRTHSKMGKARFWYFLSSFPTAFGVFLIFNIPARLTENTQYIYIFIVYTVLGAVFYTMNNIAYSTMSALVTKNNKERVQLSSYRYIFAIGGVLLLSYTTSGLVERFGGGQQGWRMVSILYAIICLVALLIPVFAVHELPEEAFHGETTNGQTKEKESFLKTLIILVKNKYFIMGLLYYLIMYVASGVFQGLGIYYCTYNLGNGGVQCIA
ncbi:MAG: MFS transporter [Clostridiales bacterium]|nr:MFS transporter [Clostridiales bacterium]